jgi:metallophosphoesterase superfamily enzyme
MPRVVHKAEAVKTDHRQYTKEEAEDVIHILYLSDVHLGTGDEADKYRVQLEMDLIKELKISRLEYLVISGDVAHRSTPDEYKAAF